jgi:hypothetical protein
MAVEPSLVPSCEPLNFLSNRLYFLDLCEDDRCDNIIPWGIHNTSQYLVLEYLYSYFVYVACGCTPPELDAIVQMGFRTYLYNSNLICTES